mgnify:CR=1 FL=1
MSDLHGDPTTWGPAFWQVLHTIAHAYPKQPNSITKKKYYDLIYNIPLFLPGTHHGRSFAKLLDAYPVTPYLDSRDSFIRWTNFIHNQVNQLLGKPIRSAQEIEDRYILRHGESRCNARYVKSIPTHASRLRIGVCISVLILLTLGFSVPDL